MTRPGVLSMTVLSGVEDPWQSLSEEDGRIVEEPEKRMTHLIRTPRAESTWWACHWGDHLVVGGVLCTGLSTVAVDNCGQRSRVM